MCKIIVLIELLLFAYPIIAEDNIKPTSAWNQAYQENYAEDSISDILKYAKNSYVLIDPFESEEARNAISKIKKNGNIVSAYMSVGTGEKWRDDFKELKPFLITKEWDQWEGEFFINKISKELINIMKKRIDLAAKWGADMVEFDNMDWAFDDQYRKKFGFKVTAKEAIKYNQTLCAYVHSKGMKCMAKSTTRGASGFDGVTYESYNNEKNWWDTKELKDFLKEGKIGLIVHYNEKKPDKVYEAYRKKYGNSLLYMAESKTKKRYIHYANGKSLEGK